MRGSRIATMTMSIFLSVSAYATNQFLDAPDDKPVSAKFRGTEWNNDTSNEEIPLTARVITTRLAKMSWGAIFKIEFTDLKSRARKRRKIPPDYFIVTDERIVLVNEENNDAAVENISSMDKAPTFEEGDVRWIGGGKSLCFQLPALMREGLTIVVSPLISLMKDQVDALQTSGIAATYLNSTLDRQEATARWRGLHHGEYRMLYVAPERLMLETFLERALNWNIAQIAIDEAHCISEWGHDFRPEYRELKKLRTHLPEVPMMALTATATERVRADIIKEPQLREPRCYVASFNRPNLTYRIVPKSAPYEQLLAFIRRRPNDSGIIYCATRKSTDSLARNLNEDGISAKPYHAALTAAERTKHQESFLRDDVRVITATIAFGMGINKPNVCFVVHYYLPKNLES